MNMKTVGMSMGLLVLLGLSGRVAAQSAQAPLVPGYEAARDVSGAKELPDPKTDYKVLFAVAQGAKTLAEINPMLPTVAQYLNTLAKYGVPPEHRHLVVMFHQRSPDFDIVMTNEAYKARNNGQDNPNVALIHALKAAGVEFRACGQALSARKIDPAQVNPDIQIDLWAMTSIINLQLRGFVRIG